MINVRLRSRSGGKLKALFRRHTLKLSNEERAQKVRINGLLLHRNLLPTSAGLLVVIHMTVIGVLQVATCCQNISTRPYVFHADIPH